MSVVQAKPIDYSDFNLNEDFKVLWDDYTHLKILKLFDSQACDSDAETIKRFNRTTNATFHLTFYLPKSIALHKTKRINRCVIMINGLNETGHFTLYDQLGANFAKRGIASILLPTPHHLNRFISKKKRPSPLETLFLDPVSIYYNAKQSFSEIHELKNRIRGLSSSTIDADFYTSIFSGLDTRISLLGFSLGGLRAVSQFIAAPKDFDGCILINSGFKLADINLEEMSVRRKCYEKIMGKEKRESMALKLPVSEDVWSEYIIKLGQELAEKDYICEQEYYKKTFVPIYIGDPLREKLLKKNLELLSRILLIVAANDNVVPDQGASNMFSKATMFRIPGVSHFLPIDPLWINWVDLTTDLMIQFLDNIGKDYLSQKSILNDLLRLEDDWNDLCEFEEKRKFFSDQKDVDNGNLCKIAKKNR